MTTIQDNTGPIEVWLRDKARMGIECMVVFDDERTDVLDVESLSMRGAQRELTGWLKTFGYSPVGRWAAEDANGGETSRTFKREKPSREYPINVYGLQFDENGNELRPTATFDDNETPILVLNPKSDPGGRPGWVLSYMEAEGNGVDDFWVTNDPEFDRDWVIKKAQTHLNDISYPWPRRRREFK
ncbi:hypothetical protein RBS60_11030 [Sinomonas sp. ASV486]|uniref:hypothetical protein n=1 Tax=Sinomonas sp. ASV486 TaxID=3051170 RepID=UPI0027DD5DBA|nr:hypothetical protein [Sinomonas sp. ASV486]MDQ4490731.1 hypothetical protein [Sinomonas sp. ASV486]